MIEESAALLPEGWSLIPLGQLMKFQNGFNTDKTAYGRGLRFANVLEVITNTHLSAKMIPGRVITSPTETNRYLVQRGDVLFNRTSETQEEVGLASVYLDEEPILFGGFVLRGKLTSDALDHVFAGYGLRSKIVRQQIMAAGQGGIRANIGQQSLSSIKIALPGKMEQEAIAEALSDADALIEGLERLIAKKRLIKQGAMQDLLTAKRRLPGFSGEWVTFNVGEFLNFKNGLNKAKAFFGHGTPIVNYMDVFGGGRINAAVIAGLVNVTSTEKSAYGVKDGDILFTRTSETPEEIGLAAVADGVADGTVFSGFVLRGRPQNDRLTRAYSGYCFRSEPVRQQIISRATYTTRALTNGRQLSQVEVFAPEDTQEQNAIAAVLQDMDAEVQALKTRLKKARQVKEGMMQNLLTGRIRLV